MTRIVRGLRRSSGLPSPRSIVPSVRALPSRSAQWARALPIFLALGSVLLACGGDDTPFVTNGANDLRKACELRAEWSQFKSVDCQQCIATAPIATCNCTVSAPYVGKCAQQLAFRRASPDCDDSLERCVNSCGQNACGCIETCYSSRADCKVRAAALEGCVTEVCSAVCR